MATYKRGSGNYKSSYLQMIVKSADETVTSSETMQDDDELRLVLRPNKRYTGFIQLRLISPTAADFDYTFKVISGTVYASHIAGMGSAYLDEVAFGTEYSVTATSGNIQLSTIAFYVRVGSGGGTLQFQWAQGTSNGGNTIVKQGSSLVVFEG